MRIGEGHRLALTAADGQTVSLPFEHAVVAHWLRYQPAILEDESWVAYQRAADLDEGDTVFRRAQLIPLVPMLRSLLARHLDGAIVDVAPGAGAIARMMQDWVDPARLWSANLDLGPEDQTEADTPPPGYVDYFGLRLAGRPPAVTASAPTGNATMLAGLLPRRIVFARLSGCFAVPTGILLPALLDRLVAGGAILVSDYDYTDYPGATTVIAGLLAARRDGLFMPLPLGGALWLQS